MSKRKEETLVKIKRTFKLVLNGKDLRGAFDLPRDASITFHVPGGGDWSNTDIEIDDNNPLYVSWTTIEDSWSD